MTLRKGESPGFYRTPSTSTLRFVRTFCPTKALWFFKATLHGVEATYDGALNPLRCDQVGNVEGRCT